MKRPYSDIDESNAIVSFIGTEVEHTPMLGYKTLFIVGLQDIESIIRVAKAESIEHIYCGANMSFAPKTALEIKQWKSMVDGLLGAGLHVTLDYDLSYHEAVLELGLNNDSKFISMISVKLPNLNGLNGNACVKLDDSDFKASNSGVWVHKVDELKTHNTYTNWDQYTQDKPVDLQQK